MSVSAFGLNFSNIFLELKGINAIAVATSIKPMGIIFGSFSSISEKAKSCTSSGVRKAFNIIGSMGANLKEKAVFKISSATGMLSALKNTHVMFTNIKVMISPIGLIWILSCFLKSLVIILKIPCNTPQRMNVQPAPCQKPLKRNTIKIFKQVRARPFLLPPKGI